MDARPRPGWSAMEDVFERAAKLRDRLLATITEQGMDEIDETALTSLGYVFGMEFLSGLDPEERAKIRTHVATLTRRLED